LWFSRTVRAGRVNAARAAAPGHGVRGWWIVPNRSHAACLYAAAAKAERRRVAEMVSEAEAVLREVAGEADR
jgi:hypothetical protein